MKEVRKCLFFLSLKVGFSLEILALTTQQQHNTNVKFKKGNL
jgi:hypothetical protein